MGCRVLRVTCAKAVQKPLKAARKVKAGAVQGQAMMLSYAKSAR